MKKLLQWVGVIAGLLPAAPAAAWDSQTSGKITGIDVVDNGMNYGFRVYTSPAVTYQATESWAFINNNANNYNAMTSFLITMYLPGKEVTIYTSRNGYYCEIGSVAPR